MNKRAKSNSSHYQKLVYWSDEDGCFLGVCPGLFLGGVHGDDEAKVFAELCTVVDEHLAILRADGRTLPPPDSQEYSGKLTLRVDPAVHRALALRASARGGSLNGHLTRVLVDSLVH